MDVNIFIIKHYSCFIFHYINFIKLIYIVIIYVNKNILFNIHFIIIIRNFILNILYHQFIHINQLITKFNLF